MTHFLNLINNKYNTVKRFFPFFLLVLVAGMVFGWKEYESRVREAAKNKRTDSLTIPREPSPVTIARRSQLEQMALAERSKVKVMVEHDNSPFTRTYPMILDATESFDPDLGDEIHFKWRQTSGPKVELKPNPFSGKISFEGIAGEYVFELTVSDDYGAKNTVIKTVVIEPEPNVPPVIEMKVRQGSELN